MALENKKLCKEQQTGLSLICLLFFLHSPLQRKYAAKAVHGVRRTGEIFSGILLYIGINSYCVISYTHFLRIYGVIIMDCFMNNMTAGINMKNAIMRTFTQ